MVRALVVAAFALPLLAAAGARASGDAWAALAAGGQVVLLRHAETTPGAGDPPGFRLDDCSTQRNLSEAGRAQATIMASPMPSRNPLALARALASACRRAL